MGLHFTFLNAIIHFLYKGTSNLFNSFLQAKILFGIYLDYFAHFARGKIASVGN